MIRALIVDDHPAIRWAVRRLLELSGVIEVVGEATDGEEALRELQKLTVDVVVLDILMPRLDGFAVLKALKERLDSTKVVVLSMNGSVGIKEKALAAGASAFVPKGKAHEQLVTTIRQVVAK